MISTRYLIDPSGIIPDWISENRDIFDPRDHDNLDNDYFSPSLYSGMVDTSQGRQQQLANMDDPDTDDSRCIGIRYRDGVRSWSLVD